MSEAQKNKPASPAGPETQAQRWAKYGANVALMVVLAIVLAGLVTYIAEAHDLRVDTTAQGINSLKPQTRNVLRDLNTDIKLVSLYSKAESADGSARGARPIDRGALVADLLDNYQRASKHITTQVIDPTDNAKVAALQTELDDRYGGKDIAQYKRYIEGYDKVSDQLADLITKETGKIGALVTANQNEEIGPQIRDGYNKMSRSLVTTRDDVHRHLREHRPNYRGLTDAIRNTLETISASEKNILAFFQKNKDNPQIAEPIRQYMAQGAAPNQQIEKIADDEVARISKLADLKVDELQQAMDVPNPVLVLGPTNWRVLSESQIWPTNNAARSDPDGKVMPEFAGEQQITASIIGLTSPSKPKVVFLRPGGGPLTSPGIPLFQPGGPLADFADRLRQYNFDVLEKDMSGTWAMQSQMSGRPSAPEPSWEEIQDAVWIVLDIGRPIQGTEPVGTKLAEHLGHGGAALVLWNPPGPNAGPGPGGDPFQPVLAGFGVDIHPDMLAVHEQTAPPPNAGMDPFQDFLRRPYVFDVRQYGDAELAKPVQNLESLMILVGPTTTHPVSGYTVQNLLPIPDAPAAPRSWGAKNYQDLLTGGSAPTFNKLTDLSGPLYGGAVVEKKGGGRLVVIGCIEFVINDLLEARDESIAHNEGRWVARFPGNGELAMNSVYWLSKMDSLIALSPAALQVSRISNISDATLGFWRVGVLLVLLPLAVIGSGIGVYFARRD